MVRIVIEGLIMAAIVLAVMLLLLCSRGMAQYLDPMPHQPLSTDDFSQRLYRERVRQVTETNNRRIKREIHRQQMDRVYDDLLRPQQPKRWDLQPGD